MFLRKSKIDGRQPKPPTIPEILQDLETFCVDHVLYEKTRRRPIDEAKNDASINPIESSKSHKNESNDTNRHLDEWWELFEKFLSDVDKLESYEKQFEAKKMNLSKLNDTIGLMADDVQTRIGDSLQKAIDETADIEQDLK